jgi:Uma2 family endonuclease
VAVERKVVTAEELLRLSGDGMRHELLGGELRTMAPAGGPHGRAGGWATGHLIRFIDDNGLGDVFMAETGFVLRRDPDHVRAPDFAFIRADRMPAEGLPRGFVPIPPDLVLEVVSPDDTASEIREKVQDWLDFGCRAVWVLYGGPRVDAYGADGTVRAYGPDDELDGGAVLPGFRIRLRDLIRSSRR